MKKYILSLFMILPFIMFGQTLEDALRYSRTNNYSTARSMGVAGAFGAMGADFGAISYNPATLGSYWKSEFNLSVGTYNGSTNTNFGENANNSIPMKLSFNSIGFVTNTKKLANAQCWYLNITPNKTIKEETKPKLFNVFFISSIY